MRNLLLILTLLLSWSTHEVSAITSSVQNGNWTGINTWNNSGPVCGDTIYISAGTKVNINDHVDFSACGTAMFVIVEGTLDFKNGKKLKLPCGSGVLVKVGGEIVAGNGDGSSNYIEICGVLEWTANDGDVDFPTYFGFLFSEKIISVASATWNVPSTWDCNCDPQFYHSPIVDTSHTVTLTSNTNILDLTIYGTLNATSFSGELGLLGNWNNSGVFQSGNSNIIFKGNSAQTINGSTDFYDLSIQNTNGVALNSGNIGLIGTLNLDTGVFATNNLLTLISDANGTARIAEIINGSITGNITMQRYIDAGATDWRFITSPVSGATLASLNDDFVTSGFPGSQFPNWPTAANPWPSIYTYDETATGIQDNGFNPATNISNPMTVGSGFWVYSGDTIIGTQPFTIDITGPPNTGNISLPMTYTNSGLPFDDGWNMIGNPYPSTIDWDSPNIIKSNINNAIFIWNPDLQQFASYSGGIGVNGGSRFIASSQAIWVQASNANPSVQVTEACKATVDAGFLKESVSLPLRIKAQNSYGVDELAINFNANATTSYDPLFDAQKMTSVNVDIPIISSVTNGVEYSINQLPAQEINIPIKITSGVSAIHNIEIENISSLGNAACLILEDLFTGSIYDLNVVNTFTAYIYDTTSTPRFLLHIGAQINVDINNVSCNGIADGEIVYSKNSSNTFDIVWKNSVGSIVQSTSNIISDTLSNIPADVYTIETTDVTCGSQTESTTISSPGVVSSNFSTSNDTIYLNGGNTIEFTNQSANADYYFWDFGDGNHSVSHSPSHNYMLAGDYLVQLTSGIKSNCESTSNKLITVIDDNISVLPIEIKAWIHQDYLTVNLGTTLFNSLEIRNLLGQLIHIENNPSASFKMSLNGLDGGVYFVQLISEGKTNVIKVPYIK